MASHEGLFAAWLALPPLSVNTAICAKRGRKKEVAKKLLQHRFICYFFRWSRSLAPRKRPSTRALTPLPRQKTRAHLVPRRCVHILRPALHARVRHVLLLLLLHPRFVSDGTNQRRQKGRGKKVCRPRESSQQLSTGMRVVFMTRYPSSRSLF